MQESFGLRMAALSEAMSFEEVTATLDYVCPVPLFDTGAEAAEHGLARVEAPDEDAVRVIRKLNKRRGR